MHYSNTTDIYGQIFEHLCTEWSNFHLVLAPFHVSITFYKFSIFRMIVPECILRTKASQAKLMSAFSTLVTSRSSLP